MEQKKLKTQRGFLSILSVAIIIIVAIVGGLTVNMFTGAIKSTENVSQSQAAFYLATSGLQIAKRDILVNRKNCGDINGNTLYTAASLPNVSGQYTVTCYSNKLSTSLGSNITATQNTIPLQTTTPVVASTLNSPLSSTDTQMTIQSSTSALPANGGVVKIDNEYIAYTSRSGATLNNLNRGASETTPASHNAGAVVSQAFLKSGIIRIDDEIVSYSSISGYNLLGVTRGIMGTIPATHSNTTPVYQNEYLLYANAGIPNLNKPTGMRSVKEVLSVTSANTNSLQNSFIFSTFIPTLVSTGGSVSLSDQSYVTNLYVPTSGDQYFPGSTILTSGTMTFLDYNANTKIANGISSYRNHIRGDIKQNLSLINPSNLSTYIFTTDLNTIKNNAQVYIPPSSVNSISNPSNAGKIVVVTGNVITSSDITTGAQPQPKIVFIDGNLTTAHFGDDITIGNPTYPTVLIVNGDINISKYTTLTVYGILYAHGYVTCSGTGGCGGGSHDGGTLNVHGFMAVEGGVALHHKALINLYPPYINTIRQTNEYVNSTYSDIPYESRELFK